MRTVRIIWWSIVLHWCLAWFINCLSSHRNVIPRLIFIIFLILDYQRPFNRDLLTFRAKFNNGLLFICSTNSTPVTFPFTCNDNNKFANYLIFSSSVHFTSVWLIKFHVFISKNEDITCTFNKDAIWLVKLFIPKEKNILENVFYDSLSTFVFTSNNFYNIIWVKGISLWIDSCGFPISLKFLVYFSNFDVFNFTQVIYYFQIVFLDLENNTNIFVVIIAYQIICLILTDFLFVNKAWESTLINFRF